METRGVRLIDAAVEPLLAGLTDEYDRRYGENIEMTRASTEEFDPPGGLFIVLMDGSITVAGGGIRRHDANTCEVKRMWTSPEYRRQGLATRVLRALEDGARELGYARVSSRPDLASPKPKRSTSDWATNGSTTTATTPRRLASVSISPELSFVSDRSRGRRAS